MWVDNRLLRTQIARLDIISGYTAGYLQVGGVDNYLPMSRLALYQWYAGTRGGLDMSPDRREVVVSL
jgi:hypothetical protein